MFDTWQSRVTSFYRGAEAAAIVARAQCRAIVKAADTVREYDARPFDFADLQGKPEPAKWGPLYPQGGSAAVAKWRMTSKGRALTSEEAREYGAAVGEWIKGLNAAPRAVRVSLKYVMPNYAAKCRAAFAAQAETDKRQWALGNSKNERGETIAQAYARAMAEKRERLADPAAHARKLELEAAQARAVNAKAEAERLRLAKASRRVSRPRKASKQREAA
jgi:hypothetical protein